MKELSILIPVYNEERTIEAVMKRLVEVCGDAQLIYIDDGSKDNSLSIIQKNARLEDTIIPKENGGKGSAIRAGLKQAEGQYIAIQDADLEYDPKEIRILLEHAKRHTGAAVFGSRFLKKNPNLYKRFLLGNILLTWIVNHLFGSALTDSYTCYKLFPTSALKSLPLTARGFELEAELCAYPLKQGMRILELPISYNPRTLKEGKKIRFSDAWKGCKTLLRIRFGK